MVALHHNTTNITGRKRVVALGRPTGRGPFGRPASASFTAEPASSQQLLAIYRDFSISTAISAAPPRLGRIHRNFSHSTATQAHPPQAQLLHRNSSLSAATQVDPPRLLAVSPRLQHLHRDSCISTATPASPPQIQRLHRSASSSTATAAAPPQSRLLQEESGPAGPRPGAPPPGEVVLECRIFSKATTRGGVPFLSSRTLLPRRRSDHQRLTSRPPWRGTPEPGGKPRARRCAPFLPSPRRKPNCPGPCRHARRLIMCRRLSPPSNRSPCHRPEAQPPALETIPRPRSSPTPRWPPE